MEITHEKQGNVLVMAITGRLDTITSKTLEDRLIPLIEAGETRVLIDFATLDYISSAGLRVLLLAARKVSQGNGRIALCTLRPPIKTVFDIAGFSTVFPLFASRDDALNHLQQ
jgi:anti-sigma B factor antagonist